MLIAEIAKDFDDLIISITYHEEVPVFRIFWRDFESYESSAETFDDTI